MATLSSSEHECENSQEVVENPLNLAAPFDSHRIVIALKGPPIPPLAHFGDNPPANATTLIKNATHMKTAFELALAQFPSLVGQRTDVRHEIPSAASVQQPVALTQTVFPRINFRDLTAQHCESFAVAKLQQLWGDPAITGRSHDASHDGNKNGTKLGDKECDTALPLQMHISWCDGGVILALAVRADTADWPTCRAFVAAFARATRTKTVPAVNAPVRKADYLLDCKFYPLPPRASLLDAWRYSNPRSAIPSLDGVCVCSSGSRVMHVDAQQSFDAPLLTVPLLSPSCIAQAGARDRSDATLRHWVSGSLALGWTLDRFLPSKTPADTSGDNMTLKHQQTNENSPGTDRVLHLGYYNQKYQVTEGCKLKIPSAAPETLRERFREFDFSSIPCAKSDNTGKKLQRKVFALRSWRVSNFVDMIRKGEMNTLLDKDKSNMKTALQQIEGHENYNSDRSARVENEWLDHEIKVDLLLKRLRHKLGHDDVGDVQRGMAAVTEEDVVMAIAWILLIRVRRHKIAEIAKSFRGRCSSTELPRIHKCSFDSNVIANLAIDVNARAAMQPQNTLEYVGNMSITALVSIPVQALNEACEDPGLVTSYRISKYTLARAARWIRAHIADVNNDYVMRRLSMLYHLRSYHDQMGTPRETVREIVGTARRRAQQPHATNVAVVSLAAWGEDDTLDFGHFITAPASFDGSDETTSCHDYSENLQQIPYIRPEFVSVSDGEDQEGDIFLLPRRPGTGWNTENYWQVQVCLQDDEMENFDFLWRMLPWSVPKKLTGDLTKANTSMELDFEGSFSICEAMLSQTN